MATARNHVKTAMERMRIAYLQPVFDEWAILGLAPQSRGIVAYQGPRAEAFRRALPQDAEPLRAGTAGRSLAEGDLEFVPDAAHTQYDALMKTGATSYLVLNHTARTMAEIRADAKWLAAQAILFELSEKFRADPLEL